MVRKTMLLALLGFICSLTVKAQQFALVDMEYILNRIPAYQAAVQEMETLSAQWQKEIEAKNEEAQRLYESYQKNAETLSAEAKTTSENTIGLLVIYAFPISSNCLDSSEK